MKISRYYPLQTALLRGPARLGLCTLALAAAWWLPAARAAGPIGYNFESGASDTLGAAEQAGAPGYVQVNWNNGGNSQNATPVVDKDGAATAVTVTSTANNMWNNGASTSTPDGKLMHSYMDATGNFNDSSSPYLFTANANRPEVYVEGLKAWMAAQGAVAYDVVVYFDGDSTLGRVGEYWLQQSAGKDANGRPNALGPDLSLHVFGSDTSNFGDTQTYTQVPSSANSAADAAPGNYLVLTGSDSDNFILRTQPHGSQSVANTFRAVISAFQIVPRFTVDAPVIGSSPTDQTKFTGETATLAVSAAGPGLHFQWTKVGAGEIANATNRTLVLANVALTDTGSQYFVVVTNTAGNVTSATATLTVLSIPHDGSFASVVLSNAPVAYWRMNETANPITDYIGNRNGVAGNSAGNAGDVGLDPNGSFLGFEAGNSGWQFINGLYDSVVEAPSLNLNTNRVTLVAWVYPNAGTGSEPQWAGILLDRASNCGLTYTDTPNELGYIWSGHYNFHSGLIIPQSQWSMIAMVVEPTQVTLYLANATTGLNPPKTEVLTTAVATLGGTLAIGNDTSFPLTRCFTGVIDEVAVFNQSCSSSQILSLYAAGRAAGSLPPVIGTQPVSKQIYTGRMVQFTVVASGSGTLGYQWKKGGAPLADGPGMAGTRTATLTISNVAAGNVGSYSVDVSNPAGTTPSEAATLDIVSPTGQAYEAAVLAANPSAYWRLNELAGPTAFDYVGGFSGVYGGAAGPGAAGPQPPDFPGFETTNTAVTTARYSTGSYVAAPALNLNTNTVTITGWIYSTGGQDGAAGIVYCRGSGNSSGLCYNGGSQLSFTWNDNWNWNSGLTVPDYQWVFVAMVIEPGKGTLYLGTNGVLQYATLTANNPVQTFGATTYIGGDVAFGDSRIFNGSVDEVAVFNRSLSSAEIVNLYSHGAGVGVPPQVTITTPGVLTGYPGFTATFTATAIGSGPLTYQWFRGTTAVQNGARISGATNLSLTISNTAVGDSGDYTLVVTGSAGTATSSVSTLNVGQIPSTPYSATVLAAHPVAYWRLNETSGTTAHDLAGGRDGTYGSAMHLGAAGEQQSGLFGFGPDTAAAQFTQNTDQSWVDVPALNLNANTVTIMAWVYPTVRPPDWSGIFLVKSPSTAGIMFRDNTPNTLGMMWNNGAYWYTGTQLPVPVNEWSLVALSVEPTQATLYVMNGEGTSSWVNGDAMNAEPWSGPARIGNDSYAINRTFNGSINEVAVFNRSLSGDELGQLYAAATTPQAAPLALQIGYDGGVLQVMWSAAGAQLLEATNVAGPWVTNAAAVSPFTVPAEGPQKFYRLQGQ